MSRAAGCGASPAPGAGNRPSRAGADSGARVGKAGPPRKWVTPPRSLATPVLCCCGRVSATVRQRVKQGTVPVGQLFRKNKKRHLTLEQMLCRG